MVDFDNQRTAYVWDVSTGSAESHRSQAGIS